MDVGEFVFLFFQAEDGIRDAQESRGLGDVYKRQVSTCVPSLPAKPGIRLVALARVLGAIHSRRASPLSLIHI